MTAMIATRPRAMVLFDLAKANYEAKRLMWVDPAHEAKHQEIDRLLDELERCGG